MKKGWKIAAAGLIILLLFLLVFKERLWEFYYDIMEPIGPLPPNLYWKDT